MQAGGLRCRDGVTENHELLLGLKSGSRLQVSGLPPGSGSTPRAVQLSLVFTSVPGTGDEVHEHELSFRVALRNPVLSP